MHPLGWKWFSPCCRVAVLATVPSNPPVVRLLMLAAAITLAAPLVVARRLTPDPAGLGTHQQLGLPPCTVRTIWGFRCPACGMTTAWSHFVRGQFTSSIRANVAGASLAGITCIAVVVLVMHGVAGTMPRYGWLVAVAWGMISTLAVAVADWAWRAV